MFIFGLGQKKGGPMREHRPPVVQVRVTRSAAVGLETTGVLAVRDGAERTDRLTVEREDELGLAALTDGRARGSLGIVDGAVRELEQTGAVDRRGRRNQRRRALGREAVG